MSCNQTYNSNCVNYQGASSSSLDIVTQKTNLTEVLEIIISKILSFDNGSGIDLSGLTYTSTDIINRLIGKDKTIDTVIQAILDQLNDNTILLDSINDIITEAITYNTDCLTVTENTTKGVINAIIEKLCSLEETTNDISTEIVGNSLTTTINSRIGSYIKTNIISNGDYGIVKTGSGENTVLKFTANTPPFTPLFCYAPLSYWNSDGSGKINTPFEGWFICNGLNGTKNLLGWGTASATTLPGINSTSLLSQVDPEILGDPDSATSVGDRKGEVKHAISTAELPSHGHTLSGSSHTHKINISTTPIKQGVDSSTPAIYGVTLGVSGMQTDTVTNSAGTTTDSTGTNKKMENRQPTFYGYYIVKLI